MSLPQRLSVTAYPEEIPTHEQHQNHCKPEEHQDSNPHFPAQVGFCAFLTEQPQVKSEFYPHPSLLGDFSLCFQLGPCLSPLQDGAPAWPWALPGMEQPQLFCARASPPCREEFPPNVPPNPALLPLKAVPAVPPLPL
uniref:Uncharacterized protein n=1 Tax=Ficedula albicollis TaxID=59894 RepID=A0A803VRP5_FICAL